MCLGTSWFLACDFQLFVLGPLLIWPMWKAGKFGGIIALVYLAVACAVPAGLTAANEYPVVQTFTEM